MITDKNFQEFMNDPAKMASILPSFEYSSNTESRNIYSIKNFHCTHLGDVVENTDAGGIPCACPLKVLRECEIHKFCRIDQDSTYEKCSTCKQKVSVGFEKVVVISLRRRLDRYRKFIDRFKLLKWPFPQPELFEAIDGHKLPMPDDWHFGQGAYGCMQSHRHILENCLINNINSILVLEDDALFCDNFIRRFNYFAKHLPNDWDQIMLGGQHIKQPKIINDEIVKCMNTQRTHAYGIRGNMIKELYRIWCSSVGHCDHVMGAVQKNFNVYAPKNFLIGQDGGMSDISCAENETKYWNGCYKYKPMIVVHDKEVMNHIRPWGFHNGFEREPDTQIDYKVLIASSEEYRTLQIEEHLNTIREEAEEMDYCPVAYFNDLNMDQIKKNVQGEVIEISQNTKPWEALAFLRINEHVKKDASASSVGIVFLDCPLSVAKELDDLFYRGENFDPQNGVYSGILFELNSSDKNQIRYMLEGLCYEAERKQKIPAAWHYDESKLRELESYSPRKVFRIKASTPDEAKLEWAELIKDFFSQW